MKIIWATDYDFHTDKCFKAPCCKKCSQQYGAVPVYLRDDGLCECINCHQTGKPDEEQLKWLQDRQGTKVVENEYCMHCGKNTMTVHYIKNDVTLEWQTAYGKCSNCGTKFIV